MTMDFSTPQVCKLVEMILAEMEITYQPAKGERKFIKFARCILTAIVVSSLSDISITFHDYDTEAAFAINMCDGLENHTE